MVEMGQLVAHGLVASVSYRPNLPSDTLHRRAAYFSDGTTLGYRCWPPPWPRCAACALLKRIFPSKKLYNFQYYPIFQLVIEVEYSLDVATKNNPSYIDLN